MLDSEVPLDLNAEIAAHAAGRLAGRMRYTMPASFRWPKAITQAEYAARARAGIPQALNVETTGKSWRGGFTAGQIDGSYGLIGARECGHTRPVYYSADEGIPSTALPTLADYMRGVNAANGGRLQAFYGDAEAIDFLFAHGLISFGWQTNARSWPGDEVDNPRAALVQRTSHSLPQFPSNLYDESVVQHDDWAQSPAPRMIVPPKPVPLKIDTAPGVQSNGGKMQTKTVTLLHKGLGQYDAAWNPKLGRDPIIVGVVVQGPAPGGAHGGDFGNSPDDWWPASIGFTARAQARGGLVVLTGSIGPAVKTPPNAVSVFVTVA